MSGPCLARPPILLRNGQLQKCCLERLLESSAPGITLSFSPPKVQVPPVFLAKGEAAGPRIERSFSWRLAGLQLASEILERRAIFK